MDQKSAASSVSERVEYDPKRARAPASLKDKVNNIKLQFVTRKEKIREASKPLYLKRYE